MDFYWLVLGMLAVWRITHLLQAEDGPWDVVVRVRRRLRYGFWGRLLDCFECLSLWISAPVAWIQGNGWMDRIFLWLALSGGAILLEHATKREPPTPPALYSEDKEITDGVLRKQKDPILRDETKPPHG
jgi:hypothetical protein